MIKNRVRLLKTENEKMLKKISAANSRAEKIFETKMRNEQIYLDRMRQKQEKDTQLLELIDQKKKQKEESSRRKEFFNVKISVSRQEKFEESQKIKQENSQLIEELRKEETDKVKARYQLFKEVH